LAISFLLLYYVYAGYTWHISEVFDFQPQTKLSNYIIILM